jgi:heat shock protein HslJ
MKRLILAALTLTAGLGVAQADQGADGAPSLWVLAEVDGQEARYAATLDLTADGLSGKAPCNRYFASLTRDGDSFFPGPIGATRMACPDIKAEAEYLARLSAITTAVEAGGVLILSGNGHELRFVPPSP